MTLDSFSKFLDGTFRPFVIVISTIITIILSLNKWGNSVIASFTIDHDALTFPRINNIVLANKKDKPVPIFAIYALFDEEILLLLEECNPPLVLEPFGSISLTTKPFSNLSLGSHLYNPEYENAKILLESVDSIIVCKNLKRTLKGNNEYRQIIKHFNRFNGIVHSLNFPYVLVYRLGDEVKTTFIHDSGYFENNWDFPYQMIGLLPGQQLDENLINQFLIDYNYASLFKTYVIYKFNGNEYELVLKSDDS
ncbi:TPA: hypothetical protein ACSB5N_003094 [Acinetobacter baumannii]|uniref:hypothetical protein n=2 Tax=Acinetobacter baumannii TaxID=470 RepID=UPI003A859A2E